MFYAAMEERKEDVRELWKAYMYRPGTWRQSSRRDCSSKETKSARAETWPHSGGRYTTSLAGRGQSTATARYSSPGTPNRSKRRIYKLPCTSFTKRRVLAAAAAAAALSSVRTPRLVAQIVPGLFGARTPVLSKLPDLAPRDDWRRVCQLFGADRMNHRPFCCVSDRAPRARGQGGSADSFVGFPITLGRDRIAVFFRNSCRRVLRHSGTKCAAVCVAERSRRIPENGHTNTA